jgi:hypothetical protein
MTASNTPGERSRFQLSLQKVKGYVSDADVKEIKRLSQKKSLRKLSRVILEDLDRDTISRMMSAYLVLKANGHTDPDVIKYLTTKETKRALKIGFGAAGTVLPALLTDSEFRSLVMGTRKQMKKQKEMNDEKQRETQLALEKEPKNVQKVGPLTVKFQPGAENFQNTT